MNRYWMNTPTKLVLPAMLMLVLSGCLTPSGEPQPDNGFADPGSTNSAPTIQGNPARAITVGQTYNFIPVASDADGDALTFSVTNLPSWASFSAETGELSGLPTLTNTGMFSNISISVSDGERSTSLNPFSIEVTQSSLGSTTLTLIAPAVHTDGTAFTDLASYKLYFGNTRGAYPNEIVVDNPGVSDYVVENLAPATYYFVATAINTAGMESGFSNEVTRVVE